MNGWYVHDKDEIDKLSAQLQAEKINYIYSAETTASITPDRNTECRFNTDIDSLTITIPDTVSEDYAAYIVFASGDTTTGVNYPDTMRWSGDDVIDGVFAPLPSHRYNIGIWYDGQAVNAVSRSVSI